MKLKVEAKEYGFKWNDVCILYWKRGKWRIYQKSSFPFYGKNFREDVIKEVCSEMRVSPDAVMLGTMEFLTFDVDVLDIYRGKPREIVYPKRVDKLRRK